MRCDPANVGDPPLIAESSCPGAASEAIQPLLRHAPVRPVRARGLRVLDEEAQPPVTDASGRARQQLFSAHEPDPADKRDADQSDGEEEGDRHAVVLSMGGPRPAPPAEPALEALRGPGGG